MGTNPHRLPYEAGSDTREFIENETGDNAHTQHIPMAVPVTVADPVITKEVPARTFSTEQYPVGAVAQRIASGLNQRTSLAIQPTGSDIYIGAESGVTAGTGYLIPAGSSLVLETIAPVYAISATAGVTATVFVLSQHRDG